MAQEAYLAEIRHFAFGFAPKGWAQCNGQLLPVNQNQALFSLLGTTFGGNGQSTFGLPNLQGTVSVSAGTQSSGGPSYPYGQTGGAASVTLTTNQIPVHLHQVNGSGAQVTTGVPGPGVLPGTYLTPTEYANGGANVTMGTQTVGNNNGGQGHENRQPFTVLNICICIQGIYPSRN